MKQHRSNVRRQAAKNKQREQDRLKALNKRVQSRVRSAGSKINNTLHPRFDKSPTKQVSACGAAGVDVWRRRSAIAQELCWRCACCVRVQHWARARSSVHNLCQCPCLTRLHLVEKGCGRCGRCQNSGGEEAPAEPKGSLRFLDIFRLFARRLCTARAENSGGCLLLAQAKEEELTRVYQQLVAEIHSLKQVQFTLRCTVACRPRPPTHTPTCAHRDR